MSTFNCELCDRTAVTQAHDGRLLCADCAHEAHWHTYEPTSDWTGSERGWRVTERCICGAERVGPFVPADVAEAVAADLGRAE